MNDPGIEQDAQQGADQRKKENQPQVGSLACQMAGEQRPSHCADGNNYGVPDDDAVVDGKSRETLPDLKRRCPHEVGSFLGVICAAKNPLLSRAISG